MSRRRIAHLNLRLHDPRPHFRRECMLRRNQEPHLLRRAEFSQRLPKPTLPEVDEGVHVVEDGLCVELLRRRPRSFDPTQPLLGLVE